MSHAGQYNMAVNRSGLVAVSLVLICYLYNSAAGIHSLEQNHLSSLFVLIHVCIQGMTAWSADSLSLSNGNSYF